MIARRTRSTGVCLEALCQTVVHELEPASFAQLEMGFRNDPMFPRSARYCKTHVRGRTSRTEDSVEENTSCLLKRALASTMTFAVTFFVTILRSSCGSPKVALVMSSFSH